MWRYALIVLHHLNNSRSQRILWLLEELGLDYELQQHFRDPDSNLAPESLKAVHPLGRAPVISDDDHTLAESGAIISYLVERYAEAKLIPARDSYAYWHYQYWLHFAEGSLMPPILLRAVFDKMIAKAPPFLVRPIIRKASGKVMSGYLSPNLDRSLAHIENHLSHNLWFAGEELSGADFQMSFPLEALVWRGLEQHNYPNINDYVARIHARSAYKRAMEKGGEYLYS